MGLNYDSNSAITLGTNSIAAISIDTSQNVTITNPLLIPGSYSGTSGNSPNVYIGASGQLYRSTSSVGMGSVTSVSVVSANGFTGTVATATSTPAITLTTSINSPILAGNGTALIAATTTGTGSTAVLNAAPTFTGTISASALTMTGALTQGSSGQFTADTSGNLATSGTLTLSAFTLGSIPFVSTSGLLAQNNADLFWDNTNLGLRVGTNAALNASTLETVSALQSNTAPGTVNYTVYGRSTLTSDSAMTASQHAFGAQVTRVITTTAPTDTGQMVGISVNSPAFTIPTAQTLLNTGTNGYVGINLSFSNTITGGGALNFNQWTGMSINSNATNTGTRKTSLYFNGTLSGATNNAYLADNAAYTGNYFINSTSTYASVLGGALTVSSSTTGLSSLKGATGNIITITNSSNSNVVLGTASGSGMFTIQDQTNNNSAMVFYGAGNALTIVAQSGTEFVLSSSPSASQTGLVLTSSTGTLTVYNGFAVSHNYQLTAVGV